MRAGFALIYSDCSDYFAVAGRNQSRSRILRNSIAPISSLITGIISLRNFSDPGDEKDMLTMLSLFTGSAAAGLDVYDQNFLFGTDNINAVQQLTTRALANHAQTALNQRGITFEQAVISIHDAQAICRPANILTLTRQAIAGGAPTTTGSSGSPPPPPPTPTPPPPPTPPPSPPPSPTPIEGFISRSTNVPQ